MLHAEIKLVRIGPLEIGRDSEDGPSGHELAAVRKRISARVSRVGIRKRSEGGLSFGEQIRPRSQPNRKRFEIRGGVPFVAGDVSIENACPRSDGSLSLARWIPGHPQA